MLVKNLKRDLEHMSDDDIIVCIIWTKEDVIGIIKDINSNQVNPIQYTKENVNEILVEFNHYDSEFYTYDTLTEVVYEYFEEQIKTM